MKRTPYARFIDDEFTLRDFLAIDRTVLANQRTFLAYVNSGLALILTGVTFTRLFNIPVLTVLGAVSIVAGIVVFLFGLKSFHEKQQMYDVLLQKEQAESVSDSSGS